MLFGSYFVLPETQARLTIKDYLPHSKRQICPQSLVG